MTVAVKYTFSTPEEKDRKRLEYWLNELRQRTEDGDPSNKDIVSSMRADLRAQKLKPEDIGTSHDELKELSSKFRPRRKPRK